MIERLRSCNAWHADIPSRIVLQRSGTNADGSIKHKHACLECLRLRVAERRTKAAYPNLLPRLDWAPPTKI
jgi:hypothetical protein